MSVNQFITVFAEGEESVTEFEISVERVPVVPVDAAAALPLNYVWESDNDTAPMFAAPQNLPPPPLLLQPHSDEDVDVIFALFPLRDCRILGIRLEPLSYPSRTVGVFSAFTGILTYSQIQAMSQSYSSRGVISGEGTVGVALTKTGSAITVGAATEVLSMCSENTIEDEYLFVSLSYGAVKDWRIMLFVDDVGSSPRLVSKPISSLHLREYEVCCKFRSACN